MDKKSKENREMFMQKRFAAITIMLLLFINSKSSELNKVNFPFLFNPNSSIEDKINCIENTIENYQLPSLNQAYGNNENIITCYLKGIKSEDIKINNPIIKYFFSRGLNFSPRIQHDDINLFNCLLTMKDLTIQVFDERLFLTQICLYEKINSNIHEKVPFKDIKTYYDTIKQNYLAKNSNTEINNDGIEKIKEEIMFFYTLLKTVNLKRRIKIPKNVFNIITSNHLANKYTSIKDIISAIDSQKKDSLALSEWVKNKIKIFTLNPSNYKFLINLLDSEQWINNNTFLIKILVESTQ